MSFGRKHNSIGYLGARVALFGMFAFMAPAITFTSFIVGGMGAGLLVHSVLGIEILAILLIAVCLVSQISYRVSNYYQEANDD